MRRAGRALRAFLIVEFCFLAGAASAGPLEDADADIQRGDYAAAYALTRPIADQGLSAAQLRLGRMYARGQGVAQDYAEAARWFRRASEQGDAAAQESLAFAYYSGQGVAQDYAEAARWYRRAADQGDAAAQDILGRTYLDGQGVPQDYVLAYVWFNLASVHGDQDAMKARDGIAAKMTPDQIAEAQRLAREWKPTK
jgi:uncharacterized protein